MPISGGDGSIVLTTKVDESGLKQGVSSIKSSVSNMSNSLAMIGKMVATAFSVHAIIQFSNEASNMASATEASVQRIVRIYGQASQAVGDFIDANSRVLGMSRSAATEIASIYGNLFSVWADQQTNAQLTQQYLNATAVVASQSGRTIVDVSERIRSGLLGNTEAVEDLGIFVNVKTIEMTDAFQRVAQGAKWDSLTAAQQSQIRTLAILEQATDKYGTTVANTTTTTKLRYQAAFQDFKNTWGQVVNTILVPILKVLTTIFNMLTAGLRAIAGLSGKTIEAPKITSESGGGGGGTPPVSTPAESNGDSGGTGKNDETKAIESQEKAIQNKIKALQKESQAEKNLANEIDNLQDKIKDLRKKTDEEKTIESEQKAIRKKIKELNKESQAEKNLANEIDNLQDKIKDLREETAEEKAISEQEKAIRKKIKALQKENKQTKQNSDAKEEAEKKELASFDTTEIMTSNQLSEEEKAIEANENEIDTLQEQLDALHERKEVIQETRDTQIEAIQDQLEVRQEELDAIREAEKAEVEGLQDELDLLNERKEVIQETRDTQIEAIQDLIETKQDSLDAIREAERDEIERLQDELDLLAEKKQALLENAALSGSDSGVSGIGSGGGFDLSLGDSGMGDGSEYTEKLALIGMVTGWAMVGLGIIVMFSGHFLLGVSMVVAGGLLVIGAAEGGKTLGEDEKNKLINIGTVVGVALIGLGVLLLFTPFWKLGLGMIAAGAMAIYSALALGEFSQDIKQKVTNILLITGMVMLVLGVILLFVPGASKFGIALIAAGVVEIVAAAILNISEIKKWIKENYEKLLLEVVKYLFIIGVILLFVPGMMNWGIAAMVAGLAILALTAIVPNWDEVKKIIKEFFKNVWDEVAIVSAALVILGIILCFTQQWLIGIGLIATGAAGLYSAITPNWDEIKNKIDEFFKDNWEAISLVSAVLVILGIILCFAQQWLIGIGLIATGAAGLYSAITPNWDEIRNKISKFFEDNQGLFVGVGLALVVLGIILICTGAGIPLGLGLLAAGGVSLAAAIEPNWNFILEKIEETWNKIKEFWKLHIAKYFTAEWWGNLGKTAIHGLVTWVISGLNGLISTLNSFGFTLPEVLGGGRVGFNIPYIPQLAKGAVLPGGKPFLAMINDQPAGQTNIEAPLQTIVDAFNISLAQNGGARNGNTEVILQIDGREFGRAVVEQGNKETRRIGTRLVTV